MAEEKSVGKLEERGMGVPVLRLLPLENGDRLTRYEFERRYQAMRDVKKAELIEGVVYMRSPVRIVNHGRPHAGIMTWLGAYWVATPGADLADSTAVLLDVGNEPQLDALLRWDESAGGQSRISDDGYVGGALELIAEVAASSASIDLGYKLRAYRRNGVREYIVWLVYRRRLDWFSLREREYVSLEGDAEGVVRSQVFRVCGCQFRRC